MSLFTHIYVEQGVREHPRTERLLRSFPRAAIIPIRHYKEVFNRPAQHWRTQKPAQNLILAKREDNFLYPGSPNCPGMPGRQFLYNTLVMNCLYDCSYCYLQGLYPSAHLVVFVNLEDYFSATAHALQAGPAYIPISYDTDLLAVEHLLGYCREWGEFTCRHNDLSIEIRTKSANISAIRTLPRDERIILAWTLSPQAIVEAYEHGTPSLEARLTAIRAAQELGWPVRLCIDPVLLLDGWRDLYGGLIDEIRRKVDLSRIRDFSLGFFRMNTAHLKAIRKQRCEPPMLFANFAQEGETSSYAPAAIAEAREVLVEMLSSFPCISDAVFHAQ